MNGVNKMEKNYYVEIISTIIAMFIMPILIFLAGVVSGLVLKWIIGGPVVDGLNLIFNTTRFSADKIPIVCGTLAVIGSFFKTTMSKE